jgi:hypothetical protein
MNSGSHGADGCLMLFAVIEAACIEENAPLLRAGLW